MSFSRKSSWGFISFLLFALTSTSVVQAFAEKLKVGFVLSTLQEERYQRDLKFFKEEADRLGFEAITAAADNTEESQAAKVRSILAMGVRAIVVQPVNSEGSASLVKLAQDDKIPFVAYDRMVMNVPVDFYVTQNSFDVGVLQAKAALAFMKKNKSSKKSFTFVILKGQSGQSVATEITRGVHSVLDKEKSVRIFSEKAHAAWSPSLAMATVEQALASTGNKIDAVLANNSGMAQGAIQALGEQGLTGKVFVAGADADLAAIKSIVNGRQQFDVLKDIEPMARMAARVAFELAKGQKPKPDSMLTMGALKIPMMATPVYPVTMEDLEERIFKPGFHTKDAVFGM